MLDANSAYPSWQDPIANLFAQPYWIAPARRTEVSQQWLGCMQGYDVRLDDYDSVKSWSVQIYQYLHSREMPLTDDPTQAWPDEALETFRIWVNQGWRRAPDDPFSPLDRIPQPKPRPVFLRMRRDLMALSPSRARRLSHAGRRRLPGGGPRPRRPRARPSLPCMETGACTIRRRSCCGTAPI